MTLIEEIDESIKLGNAFGNNADLTEILSEATVFLNKIHESEMNIVEFFQDVKNMKEAMLIPSDSITDILSALDEIYTDVLERNDYNTLKFGMVIKNIKRERVDIKDLWDKYIRREIFTQRDIVETLHILMEDSQRYITLSNLYNNIRSNTHPGSKAVIKDIETYKMLSEKMINELNLKESILGFFEKMASKNVLSLRDMTPEIWDWIHQNHFEDKFTVKISPNKT